MGPDLLLWSRFGISILLRPLRPHEASVLGSVVGATAAALHPQHVESSGGVGLAVIAYDFDRCTLVFRWHRGLGNLFTYLFPVFFHVLDRVHTQRTAIGPHFDHLIKTSLV